MAQDTAARCDTPRPAHPLGGGGGASVPGGTAGASRGREGAAEIAVDTRQPGFLSSRGTTRWAVGHNLVFPVFGPTILPFWFVGPLAGLTMLVIAGHLIAMRDAQRHIPASRYRIRTVNGGIMLVAVPMLASAFSVIPTDRPRPFMLIWTACVGLLLVVMALALLDAVNNARIALIETRRLHEEHRSLIEPATVRHTDDTPAEDGPGDEAHGG